MPARLAAAMAMAAVNEGFIRISPRLGNDQPPAERPQRDDVPRSRERWTYEAGLSPGAKMITFAAAATGVAARDFSAGSTSLGIYPPETVTPASFSNSLMIAEASSLLSPWARAI